MLYGQRGNLNATLGCGLLILGFASGGWLDPWSLAERDPGELWRTGRMLVRHAQAVIFASAFLQMGVAIVLAEARCSGRLAFASAILVASGSMMYVVGWAAGILWPEVLWLAPWGAGVNFVALSALVLRPGREIAWMLRLALAVFCFGMLLDAAMSLLALTPARFAELELGNVDGVRQRMLRLARAAAIALTVLSLLFRRMADRGSAAATSSALLRWGQMMLIAGAVGMPLLLVLAATLDLRLKYLLGIPAQLVLAGVLIACFVTVRRNTWFAALGWGLVAASMTIGMLMGLYAFEGPLDPPEFLGQYNAFARRITRLGHAYWIVQGLTVILMAGAAGDGGFAADGQRRFHLAAGLLVLGIVAMTGAIVLATTLLAAVSFLGIGALLSAASVICVCDRWHVPEAPAAAPS